MKATNIFKTIAIVAFVLLLSTSLFAQEKPDTTQENSATTHEEHKGMHEGHTATGEKHECTEACKTDGCSAEKMKECKMKKHVCTEACKTEGCDAVKAKECKDAKADKKECKDKKGTVMYECPMKCEPASDKPGECSKCGMELKKVSVKS